MASVDHVLKLYTKILDSPYLHYGYWDEGQAASYEDFSLAQLVAAQERYVENLAGHIPQGVRSILDVGCGIGGNSTFLRERGFEVEALSPDAYQQQQQLHSRYGDSIPFHLTPFESFETDRRYDLILMAESASYIEARAAAAKTLALLKPHGHWLVCDYYTVGTDVSDSPHLTKTHSLREYLSLTEAEGFELLGQTDITANVVPSLDIARRIYDRVLEPAFAFIHTSVQNRHPWLTSVLERLFRDKVQKQIAQLELLSSEEFRRHRRYVILLLRAG